MKRLFSMLAVSAVLALSSAHAQMTTSLLADVPFSFHVGKTLLPAGEYRISQDTGSGVVLFRGGSPAAAAAILTITTQANQVPSEGKLVFNRYGRTYFLSKIWRPGAASGRELIRPPAEREMAKAARTVELASVRAAAR